MRFSDVGIRYSFIIAIFTTVLQVGYSQEFRLNAVLDTNRILIGKQTTLSLEATVPENVNISFPDIQDTIISEIEIIKKSGIDTVEADGSSVGLLQNFVITSFEQGDYVIRPFKFKVEMAGRTDTLETNPLSFRVVSFKVDTAKGIADIKAPIDTPFTFEEFIKIYYPYILSAILLIAILIAGIFYYRRKKAQKPVIQFRKPKLPPHIEALNRLDKLKAKKLWQQNLFKQYHSELTEILRDYIEARYQIPAPELTSDEILSSLNNSGLLTSDIDEKLQQILRLADLAKFAKAEPLPDENDLSLKNAYFIIDATKKTQIQQEQAEAEETNSNQEKQLKTK